MTIKFFLVKVGDFASSTRTITPEGFLLCRDAKMGKAPQVRQYYAGEFGDSLTGYTPDQVINVFTSADDLFSPKTIKSFQGVDAADYHPAGNVMNASTWREHCIGSVSNVRQDGDFLLGDILLKDSRIIDQVQRNQRVELSLGYGADLVLEAGVSPDGIPYQAKWTNIVGNHVALVEYGRCGGSCRIGDQKPKDSPTGEKTMKITVNGLPFDVADNAALEAALKQQADKLANFEALKIKVGDKEFSVNEMPAVQALVGQLVADNAANAQKIQELQANQATPEKLEQMAADRAAVIADAKKLNPQVKTDGCSCEQIKRDAVSVKSGDALVKAILGSVAVGDAKPDVIDMAFRALSAVAPTAPANHLSEQLHLQQSQQKVGDGQPAGGKDESQSKSDAWKTL